ncbi:MAG TPA: GFA family protein [Steroidobacteraceae bacterium]|nr:GFA family protein [Steroidobacteraceae bacterium]
MASYHGSCQCGAVSYDVEIDLGHTITCNCSRCQRMGFVLAFAPAEAFQLRSGADTLTEYRFASKTIRHLFCSTCGVESYAEGRKPDGSAVIAVNVNCLKGVEPRSLDSQHVDGRSR